MVALARAVPGLRRLALLNCELSDDHMIALASLLTSLHTLQVRACIEALVCLPGAPWGLVRKRMLQCLHGTAIRVAQVSVA